MTCGTGQRSKIRLCSDGNGGTGDEYDCPGEGRQVEKCAEEKCLTGQKLVTDISQVLRKNIFLKDNLFLDRYAQSVTLNGKTINADGAGVAGRVFTKSVSGLNFRVHDDTRLIPFLLYFL